MFKKVLSFLAILFLAASPAIAQDAGSSFSTQSPGLKFGLSSGYYYQSADITALPGDSRIVVGANAASENPGNATSIRNVGGEVTDQGWQISAEVGYYQPYDESITMGLSFEPGIMVSASTSIKLNQTAKQAVDSRIATLIETANLSSAQIATIAGSTEVFLTAPPGTALGNAIAQAFNAERARIGTNAVGTNIVALAGAGVAAGVATNIGTFVHDDMESGTQTSASAFVRALVRRSELTTMGAAANNSDELLNLAGRVDTAKAGANVVNDLFGVDATRTTRPAGVVSFDNLDDSPTLFHLTLPIYATAIFHSEELNAFVGVGTGIMFYDLGDEVNGGAVWPVLGKLGVAIPVTDKIEVSLDGRFHYAITTPSDIDSLWSFGVGAGISYFF
ncbi:hypothetical protein [Candidatus Mycalebacterium sp.]